MLTGIRLLPERWFMRFLTAGQHAIFLRAPFKSDDVFLGRTSGLQTGGSTLVVGGGTTLISFDLEEK
jgi:hypothetical protein